MDHNDGSAWAESDPLVCMGLFMILSSSCLAWLRAGMVDGWLVLILERRRFISLPDVSFHVKLAADCR